LPIRGGGDNDDAALLLLLLLVSTVAAAIAASASTSARTTLPLPEQARRKFSAKENPSVPHPMEIVNKQSEI
jgi:hypothetical protein